MWELVRGVVVGVVLVVRREALLRTLSPLVYLWTPPALLPSGTRKPPRSSYLPTPTRPLLLASTTLHVSDPESPDETIERLGGEGADILPSLLRSKCPNGSIWFTVTKIS